MEIFKAWKFSMGLFGGLIFGPGFFLVLLEAPWIFWGVLIFAHDSIIPITWNTEYPWDSDATTDLLMP